MNIETIVADLDAGRISAREAVARLKANQRLAIAAQLLPTFLERDQRYANKKTAQDAARVALMHVDILIAEASK